MPRASPLVVAVLLVVAVCRIALGQPAPSPLPAPDPSRGERSDGRIAEPSNYKEGLLLVPRLLLLPIRLIWKGISYPAESGARMDEKYRLRSRLYHIFTSDDGARGVRPEITYSFSFAPFFGLSYFDKKLLGDRTYLRATLTTGGLDRWLFRLHLLPLPEGGPLRLNLDTGYYRRDDQFFAGVGETGAPPTRFSIDAVDFAAWLGWRVRPILQLRVRGAFALRRFGNGSGSGSDLPIFDVYCVPDPRGGCSDSVDPRLVPGFNRGTQYLTGGIGTLLDTRDRWTKPGSGFFGDASLDYAHGIVSDPTSWFRGRLDAIGYINLWQRTRVLVLRAVGDLVMPTGEVPVTFSELPWLGGPVEHRGLRWQRLRDYSTLLLTVEYRWPIWMWADGVLFMDAGGVGGKWFRDLTADRIHPSVGGSLRLRTSGHFYFRSDLAWGPFDGWQFYLSTSAVP